MRLSFWLTLTLFLSIQYCLSQSIKKRGYVVLNNQDTLYGWFDYQAIKKRTDKIALYKDSLDKSPVKYGIADLSYFEISGYDAYFRATLSKKVLINSAFPSSSVSGDTAIRETVWLGIILLGNRLSLFEWNADKPRYYVQENNDDYIELKVATTNDGGYERELPLYKNQLSVLATKYEMANDLAAAIENTEYNEDALRKIVTQLNGNKKVIQYHAFHQRSKWTYFLHTGVALSTMKLSGDKIYVGDLHFNPSVSPYICAGVEISNFELNNLALRFEISYSNAAYSGKGPSVTSSNNEVTYELERKNIAPAFSALFSFLKTRHLSFFGTVGMAYNISSYKKNTWHQSFPELTIADYANLRNNYVAGNVKLGVQIMQKFEIGAGRQFFDDFIYKSLNYSFDHTTYSFWAGYRF